MFQWRLSTYVAILPKFFLTDNSMQLTLHFTWPVKFQQDGRAISSQSKFILFLLLLYQIMQTMA